ncbi:MAG: hypothetical protein ACI89X_003763, partial [Planctomycetota bacterium]
TTCISMTYRIPAKLADLGTGRALRAAASSH